MPARTTGAPKRPRQRHLIPKPRLVIGRPAGSIPIRWDRIGGFLIGAVCALVLMLYIRPLIAIWSARGEAAERSAQVAKLQNEYDEVSRRVTALGNPAALEREARRLGMVKPGERAYVVKGIPGER